MAIICLVSRMTGTLWILSQSFIPKNPAGVAIIVTILQISKPKSLPKAIQLINEG